MASTLTSLGSPVLVAKGQPCCLEGTAPLKEVHKGRCSLYFLLSSGTSCFSSLSGTVYEATITQELMSWPKSAWIGGRRRQGRKCIPQTDMLATALSYMRSKIRWMLAKLGRSAGNLLQQRRIRL